MASNDEILGRLDGIAADITDIKKSLYGNGRPGIASRVDIIETKQGDCQDKQKEFRIDIKWVVTAVIAVVLLVKEFLVK